MTTATPPTSPVAPVTETPKAPPVDDGRFAALARSERELVAKKREFAAARDAFAKERAELEALRQEKLSAKRNPEAIAKSLWGDNWYEQLTEFKLSGNKVTPELVAASLDEKLSAFEQRQEAARAKQAEAERARIVEEEQAAMDEFREQTTDFVRARGEEYELINLHGTHNLVTKVIEDHFAKTKRILTAKEAADIVEAHLAEQVQKSLSTKKFAAKAPPQPQGEPKREIHSAQPRTLTNAATANSTPPEATGPEYWTEEARMERAMKAWATARRR